MSQEPWLAPTLVVLRGEIDQVHPGRDKTTDGWVSSPQHRKQNPNSDHDPDETGRVDAIDVDENPSRGSSAEDVGEGLWEFILRERPAQALIAIYEKLIVRSYDKPGIPAWTPAPYKGPNPHEGHIHISVRDEWAKSTKPWGYASRQEVAPVNAVILIHPTVGVPDAINGLAGMADAPTGVVLTADPEVARWALRSGRRVYAIGGHAAKLVDGDRDLKGATRLETAEAVLRQAKLGW